LRFSKLVFQDDVADLFDLVGFGFALFGLEVEDFLDVSLAEDVVTATYAFGESEGVEQLAELVEGDVGVRVAQKDFEEEFLLLAHDDCS
jgi:hypothetical protein